jgi:hypothetical protein
MVANFIFFLPVRPVAVAALPFDYTGAKVLAIGEKTGPFR